MKNTRSLLALAVVLLVGIAVLLYIGSAHTQRQTEKELDVDLQTPKSPVSETTTQTQSKTNEPLISSITPASGVYGTGVVIRGNNLSGFEGDLNVIFERSDGKKITLTDTFGDYPKTGGTMIRVIAREPCQQGETVVGEYSGNPSPCNFIAMNPGLYKVYVEPYGKRSNVVNFTITEGNNTITKNEWGVSFVKPLNWEVISNTAESIVLRQSSGDKIGDGDTIDISYVNGSNITTSDAKFGSATYYWDKNSRQWMMIGQSDKTGEFLNGVPAPLYSKISYISDIYPVFVGTNRWLTLIVPFSHSTFLKLHITGSGQTQPLDDLLETIRKI